MKFLSPDMARLVVLPQDQWEVLTVTYEDQEAVVHVVPQGERPKHLLEDMCACDPRVEPETEHSHKIIVHNALDIPELLQEIVAYLNQETQDV